jgi:hypothetical protein
MSHSTLPSACQVGQLKRARTWTRRPLGSVSAIGIAIGERKWSTITATEVPSSVATLLMRSAAPLMPSWSSALRLAPRKRPSRPTATMPSISVPRNSGRVWKCNRIAWRKSSFSHWFSIMRADIFTSPIVCWW